MILLEYPYAKDIEFKNESKVCILILHGLASTPFEMQHLIESLSREGYDVFAPIIPYHGKTYDHLLSLKDPTELYDWGKELISKKKQEYEKLIVIGFSLGAGITYVAETSNPTADAYIGLSIGGLFSWMLRLFSFIYRFIRIKSIPFSIASDYDKTLVDEDYLKWKLENMNKMPMNTLVHAVRQSKEMKRSVKKFVTPFLVINGDKDLATSNKATAYVVKHASSKIRTGYLVKGGRHMFLNTRFFDIIYDKIKEFIERIISNDQSEITHFGLLSLK